METTQKENTIRRVLSHEISQLIAIVVVVYSFVAMVILPIKSIEKDIENITGNHIMHIQDSISKIETCLDKKEDENKLIWMQIERTATALDFHMKSEK